MTRGVHHVAPAGPPDDAFEALRSLVARLPDGPAAGRCVPADVVRSLEAILAALRPGPPGCAPARSAGAIDPDEDDLWLAM